ncbi:MAG: glutamate--cysteine ligase [Rubrivivax sp.]|nr:glutamate--cysteine ligase [Rubrivivax sp.]
MVPHLVTALEGPINELEQRILESMSAIERWFRLEWMEHTPAFYASVDVRNAGFKLAPMDTHLFPSQWNQLSADMLPLAVQAGMAAIEKICPEAKNLLLVPENDTSDPLYLANLAQLARIFNMAGLNVRLGSISNDVKAPTTLALPDGGTMALEPLIRSPHRLLLPDFDPCTILLNNDLAQGIPRALHNLHEQYLLPPLHAGWTVRRKSRHFQSYEEVAKKFAKLLGMDPWLINPLGSPCGEVDCDSPDGLDCVRSNVDATLAKVRRKYKEYGINERPFVVVKADHGNRGQGILTVRDAKDLESPQQLRDRMGLAKDGQAITDVLIQEGVPSYERIHRAVAEPVVCMIDRYVVGGFYRVHAERGTDENLGGPGSSYVPLAFAESGQLPRAGAKPGASAPNRFYMYGVIGRLAMLAAAYELEATDPDAESYD